MRDYEDVARSVLRRRDEQLAKDRHRRVILVRSGAAALSFCFACALGIGVWKHGQPGDAVKPDPYSGFDISEPETDIKETDPASKDEEKKTEKTTDTSSPEIPDSNPETTKAASSVPADTGAAETTAAGNNHPLSTAAAAAKSVTSAKTTASLPLSPAATTTQAAGRLIDPVSTGTASGSSEEDDMDGRSSSMKKITSFFAAIMTAASDGEDDLAQITQRPDIKSNPYIKGLIDAAYRYSSKSSDTVALLTEGTINADFNSDGKTDEMDGYLLYQYAMSYTDLLPSSVSGSIRNKGDINGDGVINTEDADIFMQYIILYDKPREEMFDSSYYYDKLVSYVDAGMDEYSALLGKDSSWFEQLYVDSLYNSAQKIGATYYVFADKVDRGVYDLDFDGDGSFGIRDIIWYKIYKDKAPYHLYADPVTGKYIMGYDQSRIVTMSDSVKTRIEAVQTVVNGDYSDRRTAVAYSLGGSLEDVIRYYFENHELNPKMLNNGYYDALVRGAAPYDVASEIVSYERFIGMVSNDAFEEYLAGDVDQVTLVEDIIQTEIDQTFKRIKQGTLPEPDVDGNDVIDIMDFRYCDIYNGDRVYARTQDESTLPPEVYTFFATELDYDSDGECGTENDLRLAKECISEFIFESLVDLMNREYGTIRTDVLDNCRNALEYGSLNDDAYFWGMYKGLDLEQEPNKVNAKLEEELSAYRSKVESGKANIPDMDMDGELTWNDWDIANAMLKHIQSVNSANAGIIPAPYDYDHGLITENVYGNIITNCDFNSDGRSGMMYDMYIATWYLAGYLES
ncbi:MAG: hypothetical protein J5501_10545 [Ruminococcus sp.]|nr:hypothetical protein [Ruminococcus sp.]